MKKGTLLELVIRNVEESLKEISNAIVRHDVKIPDELGILRQVDVLITIDRGDRLGPDNIIIECKDKGRKAEISDLDSFISKIDSFPDCSLGIYVNKIGYTENTILKTKRAGNIRLFTLTELESKGILNSEKVFAGGYKFRDNGYRLTMDIDVPSVDLDQVKSAKLFNHTKSEMWNNIEDFVFSTIKPNTENIGGFLSRMSAESLMENPKGELGILEFSFEFENHYHLEFSKGVFGKISKLKYGLEADLFPIEAKKSTYLDYLEINKNSDATTQIIEFPNSYFQIVRNSNTKEERFFIINKENHLDMREIFKLN